MDNALWEDVGKGDFRRTKVPGGWIYEHWRCVTKVEEYGVGSSDWEPYAVVFVAATEQDGEADE